MTGVNPAFEIRYDVSAVPPGSTIRSPSGAGYELTIELASLPTPSQSVSRAQMYMLSLNGSFTSRNRQRWIRD
ncbi:hypothetical protein [Natronorubrum aibiense]|uniref:Uncharacterized protein n=1 Tax=Natronorubrum aibiense TaxID=348826 RepID=A0A5P9P898_9EURY|nr:hypothetical protein [Natronorubrum aibiense]QFU84353.1 hypothetical protein GCU68_17465 [Natronorubrum aibiense]